MSAAGHGGLSPRALSRTHQSANQSANQSAKNDISSFYISRQNLVAIVVISFS